MTAFSLVLEAYFFLFLSRLITCVPLLLYLGIFLLLLAGGVYPLVRLVLFCWAVGLCRYLAVEGDYSFCTFLPDFLLCLCIIPFCFVILRLLIGFLCRVPFEGYWCCLVCVLLVPYSFKLFYGWFQFRPVPASLSGDLESSSILLLFLMLA